MSDSFRVTVFCSANDGLHPLFYEAARDFANGLAERGWELVYGGAKRGLMGCFADEVLRVGGRARGAITESLAAGPEIAHRNLTELVIVKDLFERKKWMMEKADAFAIFPGGLGTLDEALEVITWKALGAHQKPIQFVNLQGFWQAQLKTFQELATKGVIRAGGLSIFEVHDAVNEMWATLEEAAKDAKK